MIFKKTWADDFLGSTFGDENFTLVLLINFLYYFSVYVLNYYCGFTYSKLISVILLINLCSFSFLAQLEQQRWCLSFFLQS
jgi:hypothetical protein